MSGRSQRRPRGRKLSQKTRTLRQSLADSVRQEPMRTLTNPLLRPATTASIILTSSLFATANAQAVSSAELYTSASYQYGRFEARVQFAPGDGVVGAYFLWKDGSEQSGTFWNELDFEKVGAACELQSNAFYGDPEMVHVNKHADAGDLCGGFHTYVYEWTPDYIAWFLDGVEIRRETGEAVAAYADNTPNGMQFRFNIWPGDSTFGGTFDPATLPIHQYVNWVQYSSYVDGAFQLEWREEFDGTTLPTGWLTGSWGSPKNLSTHSAANVNVVDGYAVLSLTADDATGSVGAAPFDSGETAAPPVASTPTAPAGTDPMAQPVTGDGVAAADDSGGSEGCSVHARPNGDRSNAGWLLLALGLVLRRTRRI